MFRNGYHGDTFGAMSVSNPEKSMHKAFKHALKPQYVVDVPVDLSDMDELEALLVGVGHELAAMIIEPFVQGAGGMRFTVARCSPPCMASRESTRFCSSLMKSPLDSGGRAIDSLASRAGISPDILCLGKALTGGTIGLGATLAREQIFEAFLNDDWESALMHGPTFMANPLACEAANASLDLFEREPRVGQVEAIEAGLHSG